MLLLSVMCVLLAAAQNPARGQAIQRSGNNYTLICPEDEDSTPMWKEEKEKDFQSKGSNRLGVNIKNQKAEGFYTCKNGEKITHFYLNIKVCENCYELSAFRAWAVILGDVLVTGGVMLIIYYFSTRNSSSTQKKASNPRSANPPRPPNPDYEALDPKMRSSNALYAGLNK